MAILAIGTKAPDFSLPDQDNRIRTLSEFRGSYLLLYFYPKDDTPGCTIEACTIRDSFEDFLNEGLAVLGVSADSPERHTKFRTKHALPFPLLSDTSKDMLKAYGAWGTKKFLGKEFEGIHRISYLIDPEGVIVRVYEKVNPSAHASEVIADVRFLKQ